MVRKFNILVGLNHSIAFDRRTFDGIATLSNERGDVHLMEKALETPLIHAIQAPQIDGLIVSRMYEPDRGILDKFGIPFVSVADTADVTRFQYIVANNEDAIGRMAARHFLDAGYQHFAVFARPDVLQTLSARIDAFMSEVEAAGHPCETWPHRRETSQPADRREEESAWTAGAEKWLTELPKPLAVFAPYDYHARVAVNVAQSAGLRVPDDVGVLGVDDDDLYCMTTSPQLSSVITPGRQVGQQALTVLLDVLSGGKEVPRRTLIPPPGIMVRGSSSDFALQDADVIAAVRFIRENASRGLTVGRVVDHVLLSRRTLERRFFMTLSRTIRDEIRQAKINCAKRLLIDTDLSYAEVARKSGLLQQQQLSRLIKLATGSTPVQFRQAARMYRKP
jgi:LacI family transcriptional regulator